MCSKCNKNPIPIRHYFYVIGSQVKLHLASLASLLASVSSWDLSSDTNHSQIEKLLDIITAMWCSNSYDTTIYIGLCKYIYIYRYKYDCDDWESAPQLCVQYRVHVFADSGDDYIVATWCNANRVTETYQPQTIHQQHTKECHLRIHFIPCFRRIGLTKRLRRGKWLDTEIQIAFENLRFFYLWNPPIWKNMKNTLQPAT